MLYEIATVRKVLLFLLFLPNSSSSSDDYLKIPTIPPNLIPVRHTIEFSTLEVLVVSLISDLKKQHNDNVEKPPADFRPSCVRMERKWREKELAKSHIKLHPSTPPISIIDPPTTLLIESESPYPCDTVVCEEESFTLGIRTYYEPHTIWK